MGKAGAKQTSLAFAITQLALRENWLTEYGIIWGCYEVNPLPLEVTPTKRASADTELLTVVCLSHFAVSIGALASLKEGVCLQE